MTKVVIIGEMTLGESAPPPGFPGAPGHLPAPQPPGVWPNPPGSPGAPGQGLPPLTGGPDQGLPPIPGQGLPPPGLPPGEVWPPLSPGEPLPKVAYAIVAIPGVGYRYTVVELKPGHPDQGLPGRDRPPGSSNKPVEPDEGQPDQGLPPHREPKR